MMSDVMFDGLPDGADRLRAVSSLDENLLVEASAGSGKTTVLVERLYRLVASGRGPADAVAVLTFTRKAAAEMRYRFYERMEQERVRSSLDRAAECFIGTIHSFCAGILREHPLESGMGGDFVEMDDEAAAALREEAWEAARLQLAAEYDREGAASLLGRLRRKGIELEDLREAFDRFLMYPEVDSWHDETSGCVGGKEVSGYFRDALECFVNRYGDAAWKGNARCRRLYAAWCSLKDSLDDPLSLARLAVLLDVSERTLTGTKREWEDETMRDDFVDLGGCARDFLRWWRTCCYAPVLEVLRHAASVYARLKEARGLVDYHDLLLKVVRMLRGDGALRRHLCSRYRYLLVDEFQDTDPLQAEILVLIASHGDCGDWRRCSLRPGALFVVGDPKQSIYRFRRADVTVYEEVKDLILRNGGGVVNLNVTFRTVRPVAEWINDVFGKGSCFRDDGYSPRYVPLEPVHEGGGAALEGVFALRCDGEGKDDVIEREAAAIATFIRNAVQEGREIVCKGERRAVRYGDFMVLTFTKDVLQVYASGLAAAGVPHTVSGGGVFRGSVMLDALCRCLEFVVDPFNELLCIGALRSRLVGVSDRVLYRFRKAGGEFSLFAEVPASLDEESREVMSDAFALLRYMREKVTTLPPVPALEAVLEGAGLVPYCMMEEGTDAVGALLRLVEVLRESPYRWASPSEWVGFLRRVVDERFEDHGGMPLAPFGDVVRVMNLHKAKGLEAPVVFLACPYGLSRLEPDVHVVRGATGTDGYLCVKKRVFPSRKAIAHPEGWERYEAEEKAYLEAERERLRYVAATRASSMLVVSSGGRKDRNPWAPLLECFKGRDLPLVAVERAVETASASATGSGVVAGKPPAAGEVFAGLGRPSWEIVRPHLLVERAADRMEGAEEGGDGRKWGILVHALLERGASGVPDAEMEDVAVSLCRDVGLDESAADAAVGVVRSVMRSSLWRRVRRSGEYRVEVPVWMWEERPARYVFGVVDLAFKEEEGWVLVDYKTDRDVSPSALSRYLPQLEAYRRAWERAVGECVSEIGLFLVSRGVYARWDGERGCFDTVE